MLFCVDGNNSVKWIPHQAPAVQKPEDDNITVGVNNEHPDSQKVEGDYHLSWKIVDHWVGARRLLTSCSWSLDSRCIRFTACGANTHWQLSLQMAMTPPSSAKIIGRTWLRSLLLKCGAFLMRQVYFWHSVNTDLFW